MPTDNGTDADPPKRRPPSDALGRLMTTLVLVSLNNGTLAALRLVLPMVALSLGADEVVVGGLAALVSVGPMIFNVPYGRWIDRAGSLVPFVSAACMNVAAGTIFVLMPGIVTLALVAALIGSATNFAHLAAVRAVAEASGESRRTRNLGWLLVSHSLFQFLTPMVAGFAYEHGGGRAALAVILCSGLLSLLGVATGYHHYSSVPTSARSGARRGSILSLLRHPGLGGRLAHASIFISVITIFPFVIALHATKTGMTGSEAGLLLGAMTAGSLTSRVLAGWVSRLLRPATVLLAGLLIGAALYAMLPFLHDFWPLMALSGLLGFSLGFGVPISLSLTYDAAPEGRANEAAGVGQALANIQQTALPLLLGLIAAGPGEAVMVWLIAGLMLATAAFARA